MPDESLLQEKPAQAAEFDYRDIVDLVDSAEE